MPTWAEESGTWADAVGDWNAEDVETFPPAGFFVFEPPATFELPRVSYPIDRASERFWSHIRRGPVGTSVYKLTDGSYTTTLTRPEEIAVSYIGGHVYPIDATEAAALEAAGFDVTGFEPGAPPPPPPGHRTVDELTMTVDALIILVDDI